jgi:molybdopterin/thiamine biosynthesis adenylyltransferase
MTTPGSRYGRQALFAEVGAEGQARIERGDVAIVGVGALGCQEATLLARAGVGRLRLIDRDFVEESNLQRQVLYVESDARDGLPKAEAARAHLARANGSIRIDAHVRDLTPSNVEALLAGASVVVDGSDNFEVRYLVNDWCVKSGTPWVYAAAVGTSGLTMPIVPRETPCLRCLFEDPPPPGTAATCDTVGVLGPTTSFVGSLAALEALKILAGRTDALRRGLLRAELWTNEISSVNLAGPMPDCPCCASGRFDFLDAADVASTELCGRDAVQVRAPRGAFDFARVRASIQGRPGVIDNGYLLRITDGELVITLFQDGRAIVKGTTDAGRARSAYARAIGG